jgi:hypothetical protein
VLDDIIQMTPQNLDRVDLQAGHPDVLAHRVPHPALGEPAIVAHERRVEVLRVDRDQVVGRVRESRSGGDPTGVSSAPEHRGEYDVDIVVEEEPHVGISGRTCLPAGDVDVIGRERREGSQDSIGRISPLEVRDDRLDRDTGSLEHWL